LFQINWDNRVIKKFKGIQQSFQSTNRRKSLIGRLGTSLHGFLPLFRLCLLNVGRGVNAMSAAERFICPHQIRNELVNDGFGVDLPDDNAQDGFILLIPRQLMLME